MTARDVLPPPGAAGTLERGATDRLVVHMHVPKCGGISIGKSLIASTGALRPLGGLDRTLFGAFNAFAEIPDSNRLTIHFEQPEGEPDLVSFHGALSSLAAWYPDGRFLTLLREPRIRLVSHYLYWRSLPPRNLREWGPFAERIRRSHGPLVDFLSDPELACQTDNLTTRFLLWPDAAIPEDGFIKASERDALADKARTALARFDFVELIENPGLAANIARWLGRPFKLRRDNVTKSSREPRAAIAARELDDAARVRLEALTAIDRRLWLAQARALGLYDNPEQAADDLFAAYVGTRA